MSKNKYFNIFLLFIFSNLVVFTLFYFQGNKEFSLTDEGYLWYGSQRVMLGEVPILDFMAYDPGRYYWAALFMNLYGSNGIVALRLSIALFQAIGLFLSLILVTSNKKSDFFYIIISTIIIVAWMFVRHKLFDITLSIILIWALTFLLQNSTYRNFLLLGICIGLVAVFGRNHGVYGSIASLAAILYLNINQPNLSFVFRGLALWSTGVLIGYFPIFCMMLFISDFASAFLDSVLYLLYVKSTNFTLPIPWFWKVNTSLLSFEEILRQELIGLFFLGIIVYGSSLVFWVFLKKIKQKFISPTLAATAFLALPYTHFAYSRADVSHLSQGIFPFIIGSLIIFDTFPNKIKYFFAITLCIASIGVGLQYHPGWQCRTNINCVNINISGNDLLINSETANKVNMLSMLVNRYANNGRNFVITPFWPGAYAIFGSKSPMWEIYISWARGQDYEKNEIQRIQRDRPSFILVIDEPLDGRDELRFKNTHPITYQYIITNYELSTDSQSNVYKIYTER